MPFLGWDVEDNGAYLRLSDVKGSATTILRENAVLVRRDSPTFPQLRGSTGKRGTVESRNAGGNSFTSLSFIRGAGSYRAAPGRTAEGGCPHMGMDS